MACATLSAVGSAASTGGACGRPRPKPPQRLRKMPMGSYETNLGHVFGPLRAMGQFEDRSCRALTRGRATAALQKIGGLACCKTLAASSSRAKKLRVGSSCVPPILEGSYTYQNIITVQRYRVLLRRKSSNRAPAARLTNGLRSTPSARRRKKHTSAGCECSAT